MMYGNHRPDMLLYWNDSIVLITLVKTKQMLALLPKPKPSIQWNCPLYFSDGLETNKSPKANNPYEIEMKLEYWRFSCYYIDWFSEPEALGCSCVQK